MAELVERSIIHSAIVTVGGGAPPYPPIAVAQPMATDRIAIAFRAAGVSLMEAFFTAAKGAP